MSNRRYFIKKLGVAALGTTFIPSEIFANNELIRLTILHTNDMHSHIYPFENGRNKGFGGMAERATIIKKIRAESKYVLLLDAGDIFQGTPYFNLYSGELELKLMSKMKYDAVTLGNHDFDNGLEGLKKQLKNAKFPFLCSNYNFDQTVLRNKFKPFKIFKKGLLKIGIFGIGIELEGLVPKKLYKETIYEDPIKQANYYATILKEDIKCNLVICLSHLGLKYNSDKISDIKLAKQTKNIDLIIGGHTHTFLKKPLEEKNLNGEKILINQVGWGGINIGRVDFIFGRKKNKIKVVSNSIFVKNNKKIV